MSTHGAQQLAKFRSNLKTLDNRCSDGHIGENAQWPRFLVMLDTDLPISPEAFKMHPGYNKETNRVVVGMYVLNGLSRGYCRVKISQVNKKFVVDENAKFVSEEIPREDLGSNFRDIKCYPWTITNKPQNKGVRVEDEEFTWRIGPGASIRTTVWEKPMKGTSEEVRRSMYPSDRDVIEAFEIVELTMSVKGFSRTNEGDEIPGDEEGMTRIATKDDICPVKKGYGMAPSAYKTTNGTLYSVMDKLPVCLKATYEEVHASMDQMISRYPPIAQCLSAGRLPFFVDGMSREAMIAYSEEHKLIKLSKWSLGETECVDIRERDVMRFTNCATVKSACQLLELAIRTGAVKMVVVRDRYRQDRKDENPVFSVYYGVPLIDSKKLLSFLSAIDQMETLEEDTTGNYFKFTAPYTVFLSDNVEFSPEVFVSKDPIDSIKGTDAKLPSQDFILAGVGMPVRGHFVRFVDPRGDGRTLWSGYINIAKVPQLISSGNVVQNAANVVQHNWMEDGSDPFDPFATVAPPTATTDATAGDSTAPDPRSESAPKKAKKV